MSKKVLRMFAMILSIAMMMITGLTIAGCASDKTVLINKSEYSMFVGETYLLKASSSNGEAITWASDNEDCVTVDENGLITAVADGKAKITASCKKASAECIVQVSAKIMISLSETEVTLNEGESKTIAAASSDGSAVTWISEDTNIATVSETGVITAVSQGETFIRASVGNEIVKCKVIVKIDPIVQLSMSKVKYDMSENGSVILECTVEGDDSAVVTWSSNRDIVTITPDENNGNKVLVVPNGEGFGKVEVVAKYNNSTAKCDMFIVSENATELGAPVLTKEYAEVSWEPIQNASGYEVKENDGEWTQIQETKYTPRNLLKGESCTVYVRSLADDSGLYYNGEEESSIKVYAEMSLYIEDDKLCGVGADGATGNYELFFDGERVEEIPATEEFTVDLNEYPTDIVKSIQFTTTTGDKKFSNSISYSTYGASKELSGFEGGDVGLSVVNATIHDSGDKFTLSESTEKSRSGQKSLKVVSNAVSKDIAYEKVKLTFNNKKLTAGDVVSFWVYVDSLGGSANAWTHVLHSVALFPYSAVNMQNSTGENSGNWYACGYLKVGEWSLVSYKLTAMDIIDDNSILMVTNSFIFRDGMGNQLEGDALSATFYIDDLYVNERSNQNAEYIYTTEQMLYYNGGLRTDNTAQIVTDKYYKASVDFDNSSLKFVAKRWLSESSPASKQNVSMGEEYYNATGDTTYNNCPYNLMNVAEYVDTNYKTHRPMMQPYSNRTQRTLADYTIEFWVYCEQESKIVALERYEQPWAQWTATTENITTIPAGVWTKYSYTYANENILGLTISTFTPGTYYFDSVVIRN